MKTTHSDSVFPVISDEQIRRDLKETAFWTQLLAYIMWGLLILAGFFFIGAGFWFNPWGRLAESGLEDPALEQAMQMNPFAHSIIFVFIYAFYVLFIGLPAYFLYRFGRRIKQALRQNNDDALRDAVRYLKYYFTFYGIIAAFTAVMYLLVFISSAVAFLVF